MDILQIPFVKHLGISYHDERTLKLETSDTVQNHLQSIHAGAIYTLAETASGLCLQQIFPKLIDKTFGMLRESSVKYKHPAHGVIYAQALLTEEEKQRFLSRLQRKGRATLTIEVTLYDEVQKVVMTGSFGWYVQMRA